MTSQALPVTAEVIERVRVLRKERGLSARDLADRMTAGGYATSRTAIAQGECGYRKEVSVDWVVAVARALGVPPELVFRGPNCTACNDMPPKGFSCYACEKGNP